MNTKILLITACVWSAFTNLILAENTKIRVGLVTDLSAGAAFYGEQEVAAAQLAARTLKLEGIDLDLILEDSQLKPQMGVSAVNKLINSDNVDALFVTYTPIINASIELIKRANKLVVYSAGAKSPLAIYQNAFKTYIDYTDGCELIAKSHLENKIKPALLKAESEFAELCAEGARRVFEDLYTQNYHKDADVSSQILKIKNSGAQAIITAGFIPDTINILKVAKRIDYNPILSDSDWVYTNEVLEEFRTQLENSLAFGIITNRPESYDSQHISLIKAKKHGVNDYAALSYIHFLQMARAIKACPQKDLACQTKEMSISPAAVEWGFAGWENRVAKLKLVVKEIKDGKLVVRN